MDRKRIETVVEEAAEIADSVDERYRVAAFRFATKALIGRVSPTSAEVAPDGSQEVATASLAVNEALALVRDKTHTDKFEVILYHALMGEGSDELSLEEILAAYQASRIAKPANPSDIIAKASRRGHVHEGSRREGHRTWRLTGTGQRYAGELLQEAQPKDE